MSQTPQRSLEEEWRGREPEPPGGGGGWLWVVIGAVVTVVIVCVVAVAVIYWQFQSRTDTEQPPSLALPPTHTPTAQAPEPETGQPTVTAVSSGTIHATQLSTLPVLDGSLDEWAGLPRYTSAFRVYSVQGWNGTEDLTAVWQLGWDNNNLYIAAEITDDTHVQTQVGNTVFKGDSLEIQFDTRNDGSSSLSQDNFQIHLSPGNFSNLAPSSYRYQGTTDGRWVDAPGQRVTVTAQQTSTGYIIEAAIPWLDLAMTPALDKVLGLALNADDNDTPGTAVQEVMMSNVSTRTLSNPTSWGTLVLK